MFGVNGGEVLVLILVAIVVIGPERMPAYAKQFREWLMGMRAMIDQGKAQLKVDVGDDVDWKQYDPRQYDPRRIVREALYEPTQPQAPARAQAATLPPDTPAPFDTEAT